MGGGGGGGGEGGPGRLDNSSREILVQEALRSKVGVGWAGSGRKEENFGREGDGSLGMGTYETSGTEGCMGQGGTERDELSGS